MEIDGLISALFIGAIIGALGRPVVPGRILNPTANTLRSRTILLNKGLICQCHSPVRDQLIFARNTLETPTVRCETFVLSSEMLPSVDILLKAADPEQLGLIYREAGLQFLAANIEPLRRATTAAHNYQELPAEDYQLYSDFLTRAIEPEDCVVSPPDDALVVLVAARQAKLFDNIVILAHPTSGECLLLGSVKIGHIVRYFKFAHWGYDLTSIEQLRKRRPRFIRWPRWRRRGPIHFGIVTILAAILCWLFLRPINWLLFVVVLAGIMTLCGWYVAKYSDDKIARRTVGWLIAANTVAALVVGGVYMAGTRTEEVLICGEPHRAGFWWKREWVIETSEGSRTLDGGYYNGYYYSAGDEDLRTLLKGQRVKIAERRLDFSKHGPHIRKGQTLGLGRCG